MDLNNILSLLKEAEKAEKDTLDIKSLDLTRIDSNLIQQVRNEYLTKNATTITPEVLVVIGNMAKETHLIQVLKKCKDRQDKKEKELFAHRESVKIRHKKQKENLQTKELIGVKVDMNELQVCFYHKLRFFFFFLNADSLFRNSRENVKMSFMNWIYKY